jgi:hypothetical protein
MATLVEMLRLERTGGPQCSEAELEDVRRMMTMKMTGTRIRTRAGVIYVAGDDSDDDDPDEQ